MEILKSFFSRIESLPPRLLAGIFFILSTALYAGTAGHDFVLDDHAIFTNHKYVAKGVSGIPEILLTPYWHGYTDVPNGLYRPVSLLVFALLKQFFGATPLSGHLLSIFLYGLCAVLLFRFLRSQFGREAQLMAALATTLFIVHPVHTEVVNSIKSCDELLSFCFAMLTLTALNRFAASGSLKSLAGGLVCCFLSIMSKESAICLAVIAPLCMWQSAQRSGRRILIGTAGVIVALGTFLAIRSVVLKQYDAGIFAPTIADNSLAGTTGFGERLANSALLLGRYLRLLFIPAPLISDYSYNTIPLSGWSDILVWISLLSYLALAALAAFRLGKKKGDPVALGILIFLSGIALFSSLFFLIGATFAERFLFLPSIGFCIAIAAIISGRIAADPVFRSSRRLAAPVIFCVAILVFAGISILRTQDWKSDESLFATDIETAPANYRLPYYLATHYIEQSTEVTDPLEKKNLLLQAIPLLQQSNANFDGYPETWGELGSIYMNLGALDSGLFYNRRAIELNPRDSFTRNNVAAYYFLKGDYKEAIRISRINVEMYPASRQSYANIGAAFLKQGRADSAILVLQKAWQLEPRNPRTGYFLNVAFSMNGQPDSASRYAAYAPPAQR